jgi:hypothetical protein
MVVAQRNFYFSKRWMAKLRRKPAWLEIESHAVRTISQLALIFRSRA